MTTIFEDSSIYKFYVEESPISCNTYKDIYNIRKNTPTNSPSKQHICCNTINFKNPNLCSSQNNSLCWFDNDTCKSNFFQINHIDNNKYYFSTNNIPDFESNNTQLKVDILRNSIPIKNNIIINLFKESDSNISTIKQLIKQQDFYLIGEPSLIENTNILQKLNIISDKLILYNNNINIVDNNTNIYNQLKYVNTISNSIKLQNNIIYINFALNINIKYLIFYYTSNSNINLTIIFHLDSRIIKQQKIDIPNSNSNENKFKVSIILNEDFNKISFYQTTYTDNNLFIRNISIYGNISELLPNTFKGYFILNNPEIKLKINDHIILKKHLT